MQPIDIPRLCADRGWSRARLVRELRSAAHPLGHTLPGDESLLRMVRLWANGSRAVSPMYADVLSAAFGVPVGNVEPGHDPLDGAISDLADRLAQAQGVDAGLVALLEQQTDTFRRLDRRTGAARLLAQTEQHVEHMADLLSFASFGPDRRALAEAVAEGAALAGWQALDQGRQDRAWALHVVARSAARESDNPAVLAHVTAQQAFVLIDADRPREAVAQIVHARTESGRQAPAMVRAWLCAAEGEARAAAGQEAAARAALDKAAELVETAAGESLPFLSLDAVHLARWRGHCLARLGAPEAVPELSATLARLDPSFTRAAAGLRCDLALAHLNAGEKDAAAAEASRARQLATATTSARQTRRIQRVEEGARSSASG